MKKFVTILVFFSVMTKVNSQSLVTNDGLDLTVEANLTLTIEGSFTNQTNGGNLGTIANAGTITLTGDWTNNSANTVFSTSAGAVQFIGTTNEAINGTNGTTFYDLTINNTGVSTSDNITLSKPSTVSHVLTLTDGILNTDATNILTLSSTSTSATNGGNAGSFVSGPMSWNIATGGPYIFPTGKAPTKWARVALSPTNGTTYFTAEYFNSKQASNTIIDWPTLKEVSVVEYWEVSEVNAAVDAAITLYWENNTTSKIGDCTDANVRNDLLVAHMTGSGWETEGNAGVNYSGITGDLTSNTVTSFSPFTFGSSSQGGYNPLPIELLNFKAINKGESVDLKWTTATEINNNYFTVERSKDGITFELVGIVASKAPNGNSTYNISYNLNDPDLAPGVYYYRLKQTDYDYKFTYSKVEVVNITKSITFNFELAPNPNDGDNMLLFITSPLSGKITLTIYNMLGQLMITDEFAVIEGENHHLESLKDALLSGTYIVKLKLNDELSLKKRLIIN